MRRAFGGIDLPWPGKPLPAKARRFGRLSHPLLQFVLLSRLAHAYLPCTVRQAIVACRRQRKEDMKKLKTMGVLAALFLSGCAAPTPPPTVADVSNSAPSASKAALNAQARGIRTQIIERKQKIAVFEVMLTDVERRAAHAQIPLTYLPNTNLLAQAAPERSDNDRLSVAVRPSPAAAPTLRAAAPVAKPPVKKRMVKKKKARRKAVPGQG